MSRPSYKSYYDEYCNAKKACDEQEKQGKVVYRPNFEQYKDIVNHPKHYISESGMEVINVVEEFTKGLEGIEAVCAANMIKYACRWKNKNGVEDLEKLVWYANHLIEHLQQKKTLVVNYPADLGIDPDANFFEDFYSAEVVLIKMSEIIDKWGEVSLADFYELAGVYNDDYVYTKYGWTDISSGCVIQVKNGFAIKLPRPLPIE